MVPRDFEPSINLLDDVFLYDIDDRLLGRTWARAKWRSSAVSKSSSRSLNDIWCGRTGKQAIRTFALPNGTWSQPEVAHLSEVVAPPLFEASTSSGIELRLCGKN